MNSHNKRQTNIFIYYNSSLCQLKYSYVEIITLYVPLCFTNNQEYEINFVADNQIAEKLDKVFMIFLKEAKHGFKINKKVI